jgi:hypothetical protein
MVVQVPNTPNKDDVGVWLKTIFEAWPDLPPDSVYNVFGEHKTETYGGFTVPYIAPERVGHYRSVIVSSASFFWASV